MIRGRGRGGGACRVMFLLNKNCFKDKALRAGAWPWCKLQPFLHNPGHFLLPCSQKQSSLATWNPLCHPTPWILKEESNGLELQMTHATFLCSWRCIALMQTPTLSPQSRPLPSPLFTEIVKSGHLEPTVASNSLDTEGRIKWPRTSNDSCNFSLLLESLVTSGTLIVVLFPGHM